MDSLLLYEKDAIHKCNDWISKKSYSSIHVLCDENTYLHCYKIFQSWDLCENPTVFVISQGEKSKSLHFVEEFCKHCVENNIDRRSLCIALGGGVVCDILGFSASILLRGIDTLYIPTSLMAMSDAAIGGKTGVNFSAGKNQLGTFHFPKLILFHYDFLITLDVRNLRNGFVEMIKHSLLKGEGDFKTISSIVPDRVDELFIKQIKTSILFKNSIVLRDKLDTGERNALNLGHTLGHAIESYLLDNSEDILHGEAIAWGLIYELQLSGILFHKQIDYFQKAIQYLEQFKYKTSFSDTAKQKIVQRLIKDKKKKSGDIHFSLLKEYGLCEIHVKVEMDYILKFLLEQK
ncbi:MAG: 3-dehydroquinate synthase [Saprospiraceae bacterium]|nr:3-dehydroquinate synthase [Saprospiraceae bacterium]